MVRESTSTSKNVKGGEGVQGYMVEKARIHKGFWQGTVHNP